VLFIFDSKNPMNSYNRKGKVLSGYSVLKPLKPKLRYYYNDNHMIISISLWDNIAFKKFDSEHINSFMSDIFQLSIIEKNTDTINYMKLYEYKKIIHQLITKCSNLEKLVLCGLQSLRLKFIRDCLINNKLINLDINDCYFTGDEDSIMIREILTNSISLKYFKMSSSKVQCGMLIEYLLSGIQNNQTLTHIDISQCDLCSDNCANMIMKIMTDTKSIRYINLSSCNLVGEEWEKCLLLGIRNNVTIAELNLSENYIFRLYKQKKLLVDVLQSNFSLMYVNINKFTERACRDELDQCLSEYNYYLTLNNTINNTSYTKIERDYRSSVIESDKIDVLTKEFLIACEIGDYITVVRTIKNVDIHYEGDYALRFACRNGHKNIVSLLVVNGANVNAVDDTPIYVAAKYQHIEIAKCLILYGANISTDTETLNMCLKLGGHELLENYLNISMFKPSIYRQEFIQSTFQLACNNSYVSVVHFLFNNYYAEVNSITEIEKLSTLNLDILPLLLRTKIKFPVDMMFKSLMIAKNLDIVRNIINDCYKDIPNKRNVINGMFYHACTLRYKEAIELLLDHIILDNFSAKSILQLSYNVDIFPYVENLLNRNRNYMSDNVSAIILCDNNLLSRLNKSFLISKLNCYYCMIMNIPKDITSIICAYYFSIIRKLYPRRRICVIQDRDSVDYISKL
jgi:hypothetical protein